MTAELTQPISKDHPETTSIRGACHHDCPDTCVWDATVLDGVVIKLRGNTAHPTTRGELCPKVNRLIDRVYHPDRLLTPLRRIGPKGTAEFESITWDEALAETAMRLSGISQQSGPEAILQYSFAGTQGAIQMGILANRFFQVLGASDIRRHLCGATAYLGAADVAGIPFGVDPEDLGLAKTIILWGTNTRLTNRHLWPTIEQAKANGATIVVIDPVRTATAVMPEVDRFLQIRPGTDVALVLGLIHVMNRDGLLDDTWLEQSTTDWDSLRESASEMGPGRAAQITGIEISAIEWLAQTIVGNLPTAIRVLIGPEHREHGRDLMRSIALLPAVTGAWRQAGGGLARSTSVYFDQSLNFPDPTGGTRRSFNMASLGSVLLDQTLEPRIEALFVHNCNPAVIVPDQNAVIAGLERTDLFCVVIEQFMNDTARYADIVLPATTQLEHLDLAPAWGHLNLALNRPAIQPVGQALANTEIFRRLAAVMNLEDPVLAMSDEDLVRLLLETDHPFLAGITYDRLWEEGWARLAVPSGHRPYVDDAPQTVDGRLQLGSLTYRVGRETAEGDPEHASQFPLTLISQKQHVKFLNSSYGGFDRHFPAAGEPRLKMDPADAERRSLKDGDSVDIFNDRGSLTVTLAISDRLQPGLVAMPFGWWNTRTPNGRGVNVLTNPDVGPDNIGSAAFHETLVEVRRVHNGHVEEHPE